MKLNISGLTLNLWELQTMQKKKFYLFLFLLKFIANKWKPTEKKATWEQKKKIGFLSLTVAAAVIWRWEDCRCCCCCCRLSLMFLQEAANGIKTAAIVWQLQLRHGISNGISVSNSNKPTNQQTDRQTDRPPERM